MKLGLSLGFLTSANLDLVPLAVQAEKLGYDSVWVAEAWGSDAVSLLAWIGASTERIELGTGILQIPARSPAMTAMTAATLDRLSNGRLLLGLGVSGPQVVEGWHGLPYGKPLARTRDAVGIIRRILARKEPLTYEGEAYRVPWEGGTGLGKPLKLMMPPLRSDVPIYLAAIGPKNVELATEIADGWLPIFFSPKNARLFGDMPERQFDVAPTVHVALGENVRECLDAIKPSLALYVGGMGAKGKNFYNDLARRYGYEREAEHIQDLYLGGKKKEAVAAVPDGLVDEVALCGPKERVVERIQAWREAGVTTLICIPSSSQALVEMPEIIARARA